jgi:hypothetical protein
MSTDRKKPPTEPDEDAYEDAWYRALKAKASRRPDRKHDTTKTPPPPVLPPAPSQNDGDAEAR